MDISDDNLVTVKGPKGELQQQVDPDIELNLEDGSLVLSGPQNRNAISQFMACSVHW